MPTSFWSLSYEEQSRLVRQYYHSGYWSCCRQRNKGHIGACHAIWNLGIKIKTDTYFGLPCNGVVLEKKNLFNDQEIALLNEYIKEYCRKTRKREIFPSDGYRCGFPNKKKSRCPLQTFEGLCVCKVHLLWTCRQID